MLKSPWIVFLWSCTNHDGSGGGDDDVDYNIKVCDDYETLMYNI